LNNGERVDCRLASYKGGLYDIHWKEVVGGGEVEGGGGKKLTKGKREGGGGGEFKKREDKGGKLVKTPYRKEVTAGPSKVG